MTGSDTRPRLFLDLETFSCEDIRETGAFRYMETPDFRILMCAYALDHGPVHVADLTTAAGREEFGDVIRPLLLDPAVVKVAHNSAFEREALRVHTGSYMPPGQWEDTMILAAMNGLPMSLDASGAALGLKDQKIKEGTALISYFCKPCRGTMSNNFRTRNLPEHAPEKWARFAEYCKRDVEVAQAIYYRLPGPPVPAWERELWALDCRISERGVLIDRELVEAAVAVDEASRAASLAEMRDLTGLDNPNSVSQLQMWLHGVGLYPNGLSKAEVAELLPRTSGIVRRVLELRQLLGKTSTKKYQTMLACASPVDDRIRGVMQYYGAGRTGRWAGRLVQVQNLPQNHLDDIGYVREVVRRRDLDLLELIYESVPDVLSQLIRTALVAKPGHTFLVADYSAIEARVIAYLAGVRWRMDVFANGGDIYCSSASQMFKVPVVKHGINGHLRQKGKIAELACIAKGQKVLTDRGLVEIEKVKADDLLWDGVDWVSHGGVVSRGVKEVIKYGGLEATADHTVWAEVNGAYKPVLFGDAASRGACVKLPGNCWPDIWPRDNSVAGEALEQGVESLQSTHPVQRLRPGRLGGLWEPESRKVEGMPELLSASVGSALAGPSFYRGKAEVRKPERPKLQKLRSARDSVLLSVRPGCLHLYDRDEWSTRSQNGAGQDRRKWKLRARKSAMGDAPAKLPESKTFSEVFDIVNAGPRHRFVVEGVLCHNCGYGGGVSALKAFGADKMGLTDQEMRDIVAQWRAASPGIPDLWRAVESAAKAALTNGGHTYPVQTALTRVCEYRRDKDALRCRLPSGRILSYWGAQLDDDGSIRFMAQNQTTRKWELSQTWGGKLVENIVQAYARDCLAMAMLRLDAAGYKIVFSVHDELIAEEPTDGRTWQEMAEIMGQPIDWAPGLLLRADGYSTQFYMKD